MIAAPPEFAMTKKPTAGRLVLLLLTALPRLATGQELPAEIRTFRPYGENPVFESSPGSWDSLIRERGWILKEGSQYRLWYTGYDPQQQPLTMKLGCATSPDGIHWTRLSERPAFDEVWTEDMMVVHQGDTYYMFAEGADDQAQLLTSPDGLHWTRRGTLDLRKTDGSAIPAGPFGTPTAFFENDCWYLFYERRDQGIWLATSTDMQVWTNVSDEPLILPGPEAYDSLMIAMNQIVRIDDRYYAVMHGTGTPTKPRDWCTYFAVSDDLRTWQKCTDGPVLPVSDNRSSGVLVHDGDRFRLYTMHARVDLYFAEK